MSLGVGWAEREGFKGGSGLSSWLMHISQTALALLGMESDSLASDSGTMLIRAQERRVVVLNVEACWVLGAHGLYDPMVNADSSTVPDPDWVIQR